MKKRVLSILMSAVLICVLFTGCGGSNTSANTEPAAPEAPADAGAPEAAAEPAAAPAAPEKVTELSLSLGQGVGTDNYYKYNAFCEKVAELSGGSLIITMYPGGTLASDKDAITAVMNGDVDFCHLTAGAALTVVKDIGILEIPGAFRYAGDGDTTSFIEFEHKLHDTMETIFAPYGIKYIAFNASAQAVIVCNQKQITKPDDMKGLTMRTSGTWLGRMLERWGAATVSMAIGDLATGLERNTVSGTLTAYGAAKANKLHEVAPYVTFMNEVNGVSCLAMNMDTWNSLTPEQQGWIDEAREYYLEFGQEFMADYYHTAIEEMKNEGAEIYMLSQEEEDAFLECVDDLYAEIAETCTDNGKTLIALVNEWRAEH